MASDKTPVTQRAKLPGNKSQEAGGAARLSTHCPAHAMGTGGILQELRELAGTDKWKNCSVCRAFNEDLIPAKSSLPAPYAALKRH